LIFATGIHRRTKKLKKRKRKNGDKKEVIERKKERKLGRKLNKAQRNTNIKNIGFYFRVHIAIIEDIVTLWTLIYWSLFWPENLNHN
jgi:hypothetical protein